MSIKNSAMRIAHIVCRFPPYYAGMGNSVFEMASALIARGHEVTVYTPAYYTDKEAKEGSQEDTMVVKRLASSFAYGNAARLGTLAKELDAFDLVHFHYPFFGTAGLVRRWKIKHPDRPLVITYHMDTRAPSWKGLLFRYYAKFFLPKMLAVADLLIASSFDYIDASDARNYFRAAKEKWRELPFGVDVNRFQPRVHSAWQRPTLIFVGGMDEAHYFKGIPVLLKALYILKRQKIDVQCLLVGDGMLRKEFEQQAAAYGLTQATTFLGRVDDDTLPQLYAGADLCVLPSETQGEAFGMVLLEAMASGVPVVASRLPGVRVVAQDGGLTVEPGNAEDLAEAIAGFFSNQTEHAAWREKVRKIAVEKYSWEKIGERLEQLYQEIVQTTFSGAVISGDGIAKTLGFPTINVDTAAHICKLVPGVYAAQAVWSTSRVNGVLAIQQNPWKVEIHLLDPKSFPKTAEQISFTVFKKISEMEKLPNETILKQKISRDVEATRQYFSSLQT